MACLEELTRGASLRGILPHAVVTVIDVQWYGSDAVALIYKDARGQLQIACLLRRCKHEKRY
jgi:hypothetical protein